MSKKLKICNYELKDQVIYIYQTLLSKSNLYL